MITPSECLDLRRSCCHSYDYIATSGKRRAISESPITFGCYKFHLMMHGSDKTRCAHIQHLKRNTTVFMYICLYVFTIQLDVKLPTNRVGRMAKGGNGSEYAGMQ